MYVVQQFSDITTTRSVTPASAVPVVSSALDAPVRYVSRRRDPFTGNGSRRIGLQMVLRLLSEIVFLMKRFFAVPNIYLKRMSLGLLALELIGVYIVHGPGTGRTLLQSFALCFAHTSTG